YMPVYLLPLGCYFVDRDRELNHGTLSLYLVDRALLVCGDFPAGVNQARGIDRAGHGVQCREGGIDHKCVAFYELFVDSSPVPTAAGLYFYGVDRAEPLIPPVPHEGVIKVAHAGVLLSIYSPQHRVPHFTKQYAALE